MKVFAGDQFIRARVGRKNTYWLASVQRSKIRRRTSARTWVYGADKKTRLQPIYRRSVAKNVSGSPHERVRDAVAVDVNDRRSNEELSRTLNERRSAADGGRNQLGRRRVGE